MLVKIEVEVPKELNDVCSSLVNILQLVHEDKPLAEIASSALPLVIDAVKNYKEIQDEIKDSHVYVQGGLFAGQVISVFANK